MIKPLLSQHTVTLFYGLIFVMVCLKWGLIFPQEIIPNVYDGTNYIIYSLSPGRDLQGTSFGYPLWIALARNTGIPLRLCIEILWISSALFFAFSLKKITARPWISILTFGVFIFYPYTLYYFQFPLTESLYACLALIYASLILLFFVNAKKLPIFIIIAIFCGLTRLVRYEFSIISYFTMFILLFGYLYFSYRRFTLSKVIQTSFYLLCTFLILCNIPLALLSTYNQQKFSVYTPWTSTIPSLTNLLTNLAKIEINGPNPHYVSITKEAIQKAFLASDNFSRLQKHFESDDSAFRKATESTLKVKDEIGTGWIYWELLVDANKLFPGDYKQIDNLFRQSSADLEKAFQNGSLKKRWILHWTTGDYRAWIDKIYDHTKYAISALHHVTQSYTFDGRTLNYFKNIYDKACNRRSSFTLNTEYEISGWFFVRPPNPRALRFVASTNSNGTTKHTEFIGNMDTSRPDVDAAYALNAASAKGFYLSAELDNRTVPDLSIFSGDQLLTVIPAPELTRGRIISNTHQGTEIVIGFDNFNFAVKDLAHLGTRKKVGDILVRLGNNRWPWLLLVLSAGATLLVSVWRAYRHRVSDAQRLLLLAALSLTAVAASSFLFYTFFTLTAWKDGPRYFISTGILIVAAGITSLAIPFASSRNQRPSQD